MVPQQPGAYMIQGDPNSAGIFRGDAAASGAAVTFLPQQGRFGPLTLARPRAPVQLFEMTQVAAPILQGAQQLASLLGQQGAQVSVNFGGGMVLTMDAVQASHAQQMPALQMRPQPGM